jgi:hypothetical protein
VNEVFVATYLHSLRQGGVRITPLDGQKMIYRELGSTGFKTSIIGLGGWHIGLKKVDEALSIKLMHAAIDGGINFLIIPGMTMRAFLKSAWERLSKMDFEKKSF